MNKLQNKLYWYWEGLKQNWRPVVFIIVLLAAIEAVWLCALFTPADTLLDPKMKPGIVYVFEKDECKDCEAVIPELKSQNDENVDFNNVKYVSKKLLEQYNVTDVPCGVVLKDDGTFVNLSLYTSKRETDWNNYNRLRTLAERYKD